MTPLLQDHERAALTQVCSLGATYAAKALAQLLGRPVRLESPSLKSLDPGTLPEQFHCRQVIGLCLGITGRVDGSIMVLLRLEEAHCVLGLLLGSASTPDQPLSELEASTLKEVANIIASACLNPLGNLLQTPLLPSVTRLECGPPEALVAAVLAQHAGTPTVMFDATFTIADSPCSGHLILIPAAASLGLLLQCPPPQ